MKVYRIFIFKPGGDARRQTLKIALEQKA